MSEVELTELLDQAIEALLRNPDASPAGTDPQVAELVSIAVELRSLPNAEFMRALREAWGARVGLPASSWMLELGAFFMRTETELVLKSRRVVPGLLMERGFTFAFPMWPEGARDLCRRWRENKKSHE